MKKCWIAAFIIVMLTFVGCSGSREKIRFQADNFREHLKAGNFDWLYDHASDISLRKEISREKFIDQLTKLKQETQKVNAELNWQVNEEPERNLNTRLADKVSGALPWDMFAAKRVVGDGEQHIEITLVWIERWGSRPKLAWFSAVSTLDPANTVSFSTFKEQN
jgi:hypothetical protein